MLDFLKNQPMNIVLVEDFFVSADVMEEAVKESSINVGKISRVYWGAKEKDEWTKRQLNLEKNGPEAEPYAEGLDELLPDCDVLVVHFNPVSRELISKAPNLKVILTSRGGLEHIDLAAASERNIPVINVIRNAGPVAEFTIGLMLAITRNITFSHHDMIEGRWNKSFPNAGFTATLSNLKVGLVGTGNIGIEVATRLKAFGTKMIAWDPYADAERLKRNGLDHLEFRDNMEDIFREADIVSLHLRLVPETEGIIDKKFFSLMKPTSYFINSARGGLVNYEDLLACLKNRSIAGAALDVFNSEPLPADSGFAGLDNVALTPHIAGTTEDAIPKSPFLLMKEVDKIIAKGMTERIANYRDITVK